MARSSVFLPPVGNDGPALFPAITFSQEVESVIREVVVDDAQVVTLFTDQERCLQYANGTGILSPCDFEGRSLVLGSNYVAYTGSIWVLRRFEDFSPLFDFLSFSLFSRA